MPLHRVYIIVTLSGFLLLCGFYLHNRIVTAQNIALIIPSQQQLVRELGLTDLSIWTEARYTRHPSQADLFTAFQDLPASLEHFPAGSIMRPQRFDGAGRMEFRQTAGRAQP